MLYIFFQLLWKCIAIAYVDKVWGEVDTAFIVNYQKVCGENLIIIPWLFSFTFFFVYHLWQKLTIKLNHCPTYKRAQWAKTRGENEFGRTMTTFELKDGFLVFEAHLRFPSYNHLLNPKRTFFLVLALYNMRERTYNLMLSKVQSQWNLIQNHLFPKCKISNSHVRYGSTYISKKVKLFLQIILACIGRTDCTIFVYYYYFFTWNVLFF